MERNVEIRKTQVFWEQIVGNGGSASLVSGVMEIDGREGMVD
jgi:hypothetical protein